MTFRLLAVIKTVLLILLILNHLLILKIIDSALKCLHFPAYFYSRAEKVPLNFNKI